MASRFEIIENTLVITDTDTSTILVERSAKEVWFDTKKLDNGTIFIYDKDGININAAKIYEVELTEAQNSQGTAFTAATFRNFARSNFSTASGGSGAGFTIPDSASTPFADIAARNTWASNNLNELLKDSTIVQVAGTPNTWYLWTGESKPLSHDASLWQDRTPVIKGEKGPQGDFSLVTSNNLPRKNPSGDNLIDSNLSQDANGDLEARKSLRVSAGSVGIGEQVTISEFGDTLGLYDGISGNVVLFPRSSFNTTGQGPLLTSNFGAAQDINFQSDDTITITTNPLVFTVASTVVAPNKRLITKVEFKTDAAMQNVRFKFTDVASSKIIRYLPPDRKAFDDGNGGLNLSASSTITFNLSSKATNSANVFNLGHVPFEVSPGQQIQIEIRADSVSLKGNSSNVPYLKFGANDGQDINVATLGDFLRTGQVPKYNNTTKNLINSGVAIASDEDQLIQAAEASTSSNPVSIIISNDIPLTTRTLNLSYDVSILGYGYNVLKPTTSSTWTVNGAHNIFIYATIWGDNNNAADVFTLTTSGNQPTVYIKKLRFLSTFNVGVDLRYEEIDNHVTVNTINSGGSIKEYWHTTNTNNGSGGDFSQFTTTGQIFKWNQDDTRGEPAPILANTDNVNFTSPIRLNNNIQLREFSNTLYLVNPSNNQSSPVHKLLFKSTTVTSATRSFDISEDGFCIIYAGTADGTFTLPKLIDVTNTPPLNIPQNWEIHVINPTAHNISVNPFSGDSFASGSTPTVAGGNQRTFRNINGEWHSLPVFWDSIPSSGNVDLTQFTTSGQIAVWNSTQSRFVPASFSQDLDEIIFSTAVRVPGSFGEGYKLSGQGELHGGASNGIYYTDSTNKVYSLLHSIRKIVEFNTGGIILSGINSNDIIRNTSSSDITWILPKIGQRITDGATYIHGFNFNIVNETDHTVTLNVSSITSPSADVYDDDTSSKIIPAHHMAYVTIQLDNKWDLILVPTGGAVLDVSQLNTNGQIVQWEETNNRFNASSLSEQSNFIESSKSIRVQGANTTGFQLGSNHEIHLLGQSGSEQLVLTDSNNESFDLLRSHLNIVRRTESSTYNITEQSGEYIIYENASPSIWILPPIDFGGITGTSKTKGWFIYIMVPSTSGTITLQVNSGSPNTFEGGVDTSKSLTQGWYLITIESDSVFGFQELGSLLSLESGGSSNTNRRTAGNDAANLQYGSVAKLAHDTQGVSELAALEPVTTSDVGNYGGIPLSESIFGFCVTNKLVSGVQQPYATGEQIDVIKYGDITGIVLDSSTGTANDPIYIKEGTGSRLILSLVLSTDAVRVGFVRENLGSSTYDITVDVESYNSNRLINAGAISAKSIPAVPSSFISPILRHKNNVFEWVESTSEFYNAVAAIASDGAFNAQVGQSISFSLNGTNGIINMPTTAKNGDAIKLNQLNLIGSNTLTIQTTNGNNFVYQKIDGSQITDTSVVLGQSIQIEFFRSGTTWRFYQ